MLVGDKQNKKEEITFWDKESEKGKYLKFEKKVYSAFRVAEYVEMINKCIGRYNVNLGAKVLDIGCGSGVSTIVWDKMGYDAIGIDLSSGLISQAQQLAKEENSSARFKIGDVSKMDYDDNYFDVCFMAGLLHHFPNYDPVLTEIFRVLKSGGIMISVEPNLLNMAYRLSFYLVNKKKGVTLNEYPLSPINLKCDLERYFKNVQLFQFRENDIPFLRQLGWFGKSIFGVLIKQITLLVKNNCLPKIKRGTFFIAICKK
jgi:ubiquinone/menaquinone biosynthesis C-methylase UbiE